jgi:hypothetical protein
VLIKIFGAYTLLAIPSMYYNWYGSGYTPAQKADMQEFDGVNPLFFTTLGSWGEKSVQCREGPEGTSFSMECSTGVFTSLEAYYGQPTGSCSCPSDQQVVTDPRDNAQVCPGKPDYSKLEQGECTSKKVRASRPCVSRVLPNFVLSPPRSYGLGGRFYFIITTASLITTSNYFFCL